MSAIALWKITPAFASWIASPYNFLFRNNVLNADSVVLELGAGISGIVGLCLAPLVKQYILTDQEYVLKMLKQNVDQNKPEQQSSKERHRKTSARDNARGANTADRVGRLEILPLDWETSDVRGIESQLDTRPSILVAADCIFNPAIIGPFVSTLADLSVLGNNQGRPVISFIAQQLRSPDVFAEWLETMLRRFNVWRIREKALHVSRSGEDARLAISNGFLVHVCFLRDETSSYKHH